MVRTCGVISIFTSKCASRRNFVTFERLNWQKCSEPEAFSTFCFRNVLRANNAVRLFNVSNSKSAPNPQCFAHFDIETCFAPQRVHFWNISTSKSVPTCFAHFDLHMCFAPQRHTNFHLSSPHGPAPAAQRAYLSTLQSQQKHWRKKCCVLRLFYFFVPASFPGCVARVPVSLWGGWGCVRSTLRLRPQPSATVSNRPQPSAVLLYGRVYGKFCKRVTLGGCQHRVASFRVAGVALFDLSKCFATRRKSFCVAGAILWRRFQMMRCIFRGKRSALATSIVISRGRRSTLDVSCCMFLRISLSGLRQVATRCKLRGGGGVLWDVLTIDGNLARKFRFWGSWVSGPWGNSREKVDFEATQCENWRKPRTKHRFWGSWISGSLGKLTGKCCFSSYTIWKLVEASHEMLVLMLQRVSSRVSGLPLALPCLWGKLQHIFEGFNAGCNVFLRSTLGTVPDIVACLQACRESFCVTGNSPHSTLYTLHFTLCTLHSTLYTPHFTLQTLRSTLRTPHFTLHTPHSTLYTRHSTLYTPHSTLYTLHFTLHTLHSTLHTLHSTLYIPHSHTVHPTPHSTLYTPHSTLYTPHFTLYTLYSTLYTPHFTLYTLDPTLYTLHSTLYTIHSTLYTVHSTLPTLHYTLCTLHSTLYTRNFNSTLYTPDYTPHFTLHTPHSTLNTPHFTLYTLRSTLYTLHSTLCTLHSRLYIPHSTLHALHSALYTVHSRLYTPHSTLYTPPTTLCTPPFSAFHSLECTGTVTGETCTRLFN